MNNNKWYMVKFPTTKNLGAFKHTVTESMYETKEENALWHFNNALEHDGLPPVNELPEGTQFLDYTPA